MDQDAGLTNGQILQKLQALDEAAASFETVRARYAIQQTTSNYREALEDYNDLLGDLAEEYEISLEEGVPDDAPVGFVEDLDELLQRRPDPQPSTHKMPRSVLEDEDERGADIAVALLDALDDWMIVDSLNE